jgi:hypothetical protein
MKTDFSPKFTSRTMVQIPDIPGYLVVGVSDIDFRGGEVEFQLLRSVIPDTHIVVNDAKEKLLNGCDVDIFSLGNSGEKLDRIRLKNCKYITQRLRLYSQNNDESLSKLSLIMNYDSVEYESYTS